MGSAFYPLRVRENILPLSLAGTLPEAFKEWYFAEKIQDHENCEATCELCDQEDLRYHFLIRNQHTKRELWVGSKCILKFGLSVYDGNRLLDDDQAKKKLNKLTQKMQIESCIKSLQKLAFKEKNSLFDNALNFYSTNKYLTPKFAFVIFWRLQKNNIDHHPSFFKVSLKKNKYKDDLKAMETARVHLFWKALTKPQRDLAISLGHQPPNH